MLIGIVGFIGSGKGTVGNTLQKGFFFTKDSFAAPLKDAAAAIFNWDRNMLEGDTEESRAWRERPDEYWSKAFGYEFTPRLALQWLGTESCREVFHKDIWVNALLKRYHDRDYPNTVVTDCRFKNEIEAIRNAEGKVVRVQRGPNPEWYHIAWAANNGSDDARRIMNEKYQVHVSEWDWIGSEIDYIIFNNGTLAELEDEVRKVLTLGNTVL